MRHALLPATAALAVLAALVLVGAGFAVNPPGLPAEADGPQEAANRELAQAFYDAANTVIATGDPAPLAVLIAPGFIEPDIAPGTASGRDALIGRLLAIHAADSRVRIEVAALAADGDRVIVHVRVSEVAAPTFLGLRLDARWIPWGPLDIFRLADGRITERRGVPGEPAPAPALAQIALDVSRPERRTLDIVRFTLDAGAGYVAPAATGPRHLVAIAGSVTVEHIANAGAGTSAAGRRGVSDPVTTTTLAAGDHLLLPPGAQFGARNTGRAPAGLLAIVIAIEPPADASASHPHSDAGTATTLISDPDMGVAIDVLAGGLVVSVPEGRAALSVGRATLAPGERLGWSSVTGSVLLHVDAGTVDLSAIGGTPWYQSDTARRWSTSDSVAVVAGEFSAGDGALLEAGTKVEGRAGANEPATLLVVTILPM